jgi:hypothetical protein
MGKVEHWICVSPCLGGFALSGGGRRGVAAAGLAAGLAACVTLSGAHLVRRQGQRAQIPKMKVDQGGSRWIKAKKKPAAKNLMINLEKFSCCCADGPRNARTRRPRSCQGVAAELELGSAGASPCRAEVQGEDREQDYDKDYD